MLVFLRKLARTWAAKLLLLLLVASFAVWGVSASLFSSASDAVVTVGDQQVSANEFALAYQRQVSDLSRRFGTQLTTEQARAFGIENQVYAQLSAGAALDQLSQDMQLGLSKDRLAGLIAEDPAFHGSNGEFDRQLFTARLRNSGLRENDYIEERSKVAVRSQLVEAVADGFKAPQVLVDALKLYRNESRTIDYLLLTNANIDPIAAPADDVLKTWFETVKSSYRAPEYRGFTYVKLEPADIADPSTIGDDAVREDYDRRKSAFEIPGSRTIEQLSFADKAAAEAAQAKLSAGTTFDALVLEQGKTATDTLLGDFTREQMPDPALADAAFAVSTDGGTTPVVEGAFGPVILRITNIKPDRTRSFDEVKDEIRMALATNAAVQDILTVHDKFEDLRASGSSLEEAATELKLTLRKVEAVDRRGLDMAEKPVADLPESQRLIAEVFQTEPGVEALPVNIGRDGYVWFDVTNITPERDRALDEVRDAAIANWTAEQQKTALAAKAEVLKQRAVAGESLADIASSLSIAVETKSGLTRSADDPVLGNAAVAAAFGGAAGLVASATGADPATQILLKVTAVDPSASGNPLNNEEAQINAIATAAGDDILDQMVTQLQKDYGVSINQALAQQAMVRQ